MPDGHATTTATPFGGAFPGSHRTHVLTFVTDQASETALREGLAEVADAIEARRGGIAVACTALQKLATPRVLVVDMTGEEQPLIALGGLADVVEPDVTVLVIGEQKDMEFYRAVTRTLGAMEYLAKPLTRDLVARHFAPIVRGHATSAEGVTGGRLVSVTGVRGGVGASMIAVSLAWHFGVTMRRHTVLLDGDLYRGTAALLLDVDPGLGLAATLEAPERIDTLLAERVALPAADRLHVLASQCDLGREIDCAPGAAGTLIDTLRRRYNAIIADAPFGASALQRDLMKHAQQRILVLTPTLPSVRDTLRMLALCREQLPPQRPVLVLNRLGIPGGLARAQIEEALRVKVDVVIPDLPRQVNSAALLGAPAAGSGAFRTSILQLAQEVGLVQGSDADPAPKRRGILGFWRR